MNAKTCALVLCLMLISGSAFAQSEQKEIAILEIGGAVSQTVTSGAGSSGGPTVAVEYTPIENKLELEAGVTPLFTAHSTEWDVDLLFKKPWTLSKKVEFMAGVGPEWIHVNENHVATNAAGAEGALDFMFWPSPKRKFGWYLEPAYDYSFGAGHEQSIGISGGLLITIR